MDQNNSVDNDLQKAIDNITNTTNEDPVFSDPVAAPSSIPEDDTGELGDPIGPFPEAKVGVVTPGPEPIAPLESMNIPEFNNPDLTPPPVPSGPSLPPAPLPPQNPSTTPLPNPEIPTPVSEPTSASEPKLSPEPEPTPKVEEVTVEESSVEEAPLNSNTNEIKKAALRDLAPLLEKVTMEAPQKFKIYQDIIEDLNDTSVLEPAYNAAREISDETERAEALLSIVESIDKM